jgi:hypothetical protein
MAGTEAPALLTEVQQLAPRAASADNYLATGADHALKWESAWIFGRAFLCRPGTYLLEAM